MSKYSHPMLQEYTHKVSTILQNIQQPAMTVNQFVKLLSQNQIKFFSIDDITKFTRISNPFDKISIREAFTYLELIYVNVYLEVKYFIVKFTGRSFKILKLKPIQVKKHNSIHSVQLCIDSFYKKMTKLYGRDNFWFKALGGVPGSNTIKRFIFEKRVSKVFQNTCHSTCISKFMKYITNQDSDSDILWADFRVKVNLCNFKTINLNNEQNEILIEQQNQAKESRRRIKPKQIKIQTLQPNTDPHPAHKMLSVSQNVILSKNPNQQEQDKHRHGNRKKRLKTSNEKARIAISLESWNLELEREREKESVTIHSKNVYKINGPFKRCISSFSNIKS